MRNKSLRNKNGFTVIELILSFAFVSALAAALFGAVVNYRDKEEKTTVETRLVSFKNKMTLEIQKDIETRLLKNIEYCTEDGKIVNRCVIFNFLDGSHKILKTDYQEEADDWGQDHFAYSVPYLIYGDYQEGNYENALKFDIPDAINMDVNNDYTLKFTTSDDALENNAGLYNVNISFTHMKYDDLTVDINIIATGLSPMNANAKTYPVYSFGDKVEVQLNATTTGFFYVLHDSEANNARAILIADSINRGADTKPITNEIRMKFNSDKADGNKYATSNIRNYLENTLYKEWTSLESKSSIRLATFEEMAYINAICPELRDRTDENTTIYLRGEYQPVMKGDFWLMTDYYAPGQEDKVWVVYENEISGEQMFDKAIVDSDYVDANHNTHDGYGVKPVIEIRKEYILGKVDDD